MYYYTTNLLVIQRPTCTAQEMADTCTVVTQFTSGWACRAPTFFIFMTSDDERRLARTRAQILPTEMLHSPYLYKSWSFGAAQLNAL